MKRLKNKHPFHGKSFPLHLSFIIAFAMMPVLLVLSVPWEWIMPLMLLTAFAVLVLSYFIMNRLSDSERALIANTSTPLWHPINDSVKTRIFSKYSESQYSLSKMLNITLIVGVCVFVFGIMPGRRNTEPGDPAMILPIAVIVAVVTFLAMMLVKGRGKMWLDIDESAMYTVVPIDHVFDVKHTEKRGRSLLSGSRTWYVNYLVFYQPDGKYILRIPDGVHDVEAVMVIKFRGNTTWVPVCRE